MASLPVLGQSSETFEGKHYSKSRVRHDGGTNTVNLPGGVLSAAALVASGTAPTLSVNTAASDQAEGSAPTAGGAPVNDGAAVWNVVGGTAQDVTIIALHSGNAAAL